MKYLLIFILFLTHESRAEKFPDYRLGLRTQQVATNLEFVSKIDPVNSLSLRPAESSYFGVILGYKWMAGTVYFNAKANPEVIAAEGESIYADYQLSLYFNKFGFEIGFNRFKGFLIEEESLGTSVSSSSSYYKLPDLETKGYGFNLYYVFNEKTFSMPSAFDQSDIQKNSAGSWIGTFSYRHQEVSNNNESIIPSSLQSNFGSDAMLSGTTMDNVSTGIGYAYNWIIGSAGFFIAPYLGISGGYSWGKWDLGSDDSRSKNGFIVNVQNKLALGFSRHTFLVTISAAIDQFSQHLDNIELKSQNYWATFSLAFRF